MAGEAILTAAGTGTGVFLLAQAEGVPVAAPETPAAEIREELGAEIEEGVGVEDHAAEEGEGTFPPFDPTYFASQLLWLAITFVALYLLMSRVIIPRIGGILEDRRDRIARDLDQAGRLKQQSEEAVASYERALAEARSRAQKIASEARDKAKDEAGARQAETEAALDGRLAAAEARIGDIKRKALADVGAIASEAAEAVVERLLGSKPSAAELNSAVEGAQTKESAGA